MKISAKQNRELIMINPQNTQNENEAEKIILQVPEQYEDFNKKIVFITPDGNVWDVITNNEYLINKAITKYEQVDFYIWLTKGDVDFRSITKTLKFYHNEDASDEITPEEISGVNTVVNLLEEEISKVENIDITATKVGTVTTISITNKEGEIRTVEIHDGEKGEQGIQGLKGDKGDKGEQGIQGDKGEQGIQGEKGKDGINGINGQDGHTPIKGTDYWTTSDKAEIVQDTIQDLQPTLNINLQSAKDYTDNQIARDFKNISYDNNTATFVFTRHDNTTFTVDLPIEQTVKNGYYDNLTEELVLVLVSNQEIRIPASGLIDDYSGQTSATIQVTISADNKITCNIVSGSISKTLLTSELQTEINNKANRSELPSKTSQLTNDSDFTTKTYVDNLFNSIVDGDEVSY